MGPRGDVLHRKVRHRVCERHAHQSRGVWNIPAPSKRTASSRLLQIPRKQGQHIGPLIVRNDVRSLHASAYSNLRPDQILILTPMPLPSPEWVPSGRGRSSRVTCPGIFFVEWIESCCRLARAHPSDRALNGDPEDATTRLPP